MKRLLPFLLIAIILVPSFVRADGNLQLTATTDTFELTTAGATVNVDYQCSYVDRTSTTYVPKSSNGNIASATTTTVIAAPADSSTQRQVKACVFNNRSTTIANVLTFKFDTSATERVLFSASIAPGEAMQYTSDDGFRVLTAIGTVKTGQVITSGYTGKTFPLVKVSTASDAAGYWMSFGKDAGIPGAWNFGSPGTNGYTTACNAVSNATAPIGASQMGSNYLPDPATGSWYLTNASFTGASTGMIYLIDVVWVNTGLSVTTTTEQTFTSGAFPARDNNGSTDGVGYIAALDAIAALGNGATISNSTIKYHDESNNAGAVGIFSALVGFQAPATPVIGTWMPFQLAAGDLGMRTLDSITLNTTYTSGTMSLFVYRILATIPIQTNYLGVSVNFPAPGVRIYNGSCIQAIAVTSSTSVMMPTGTYTLVEQ